eukprot:CAMPEP_0198429690 /NCGR_PEP_ID=MMETSP1452-20131203/8989_1 /TAXON_ID=1181717 /ORGANISM="Synchroma pusillum, Strain CCMP3072" /LENGTH=194 /DNA_ID=CAMNT_0044150107 /DNA_START=11 /DNA_END=595 /DNA_ORIENTATION=+
MEHVMELLSERKSALLSLLGVQSVFVLCFAICSFVVADTANMGFNVVLTAILNVGFCGGTYYVIRKSQTPLGVGFLIGASTGLTILSLMTAVYWGQLGECETTKTNIDQYSCDNKSGYRAVSAFASLLFITQFAFTILVVVWKDNVIGDTGLYEDISGQPDTSGAPYGGGSFDPPPSKPSDAPFDSGKAVSADL